MAATETGSAITIWRGYVGHTLAPYTYLVNPAADAKIWAATALATAALTLALHLKEKTDTAMAATAAILAAAAIPNLTAPNRPLAVTATALALAAAVRSPRHRRGTATYTLALLAAAETGAAASYLLQAAALPNPLATLRGLDTPLFYSLHWTAPALYPILAYSWLLAPATLLLAHMLKQRGATAKQGWPALPAALALATLLGAMPYLPTLNPTGRYVGVDAIIRYDPHLRQMLRSGGARFALRSDRPLFYLTLYLLGRQLGVQPVVKAMPLACVLLYVAATHVLAAKLYHDKEARRLAVYLAATSITTTMGIFAGLYTNWAAYSLSYLTIATALAATRAQDGKRGALLIIGAALLGTATLATHPYHWIAVAATLAGATAITLLQAATEKRKSRVWEAACLAAPLASTLALAAAATLLGWRNPLEKQFWGSLQQLARLATHPDQAFTRQWWKNLTFYIYNYGIASFINPPLLALAAIGSPPTRLRAADKILLSWLATVSALILVQPYNRYLYVLPVNLYAARGLRRIQKAAASATSPGAARALTALILAQQTAYALRFVTLAAGAPV